jgi:hypothetical protein
MPGRNGYEVCEHIKRSERFRHIPVMLLVGSFEPFDEAEARRVGADDFLTKPFQSIRQLVNKVGALLSGAAPAEDEATTQDLQLPAGAARAKTEKSAKPTELSMADTAPLPQLREGAAAHLASNDPAGHASFDDELIESAPASSFGRTDGNRQMQPTAPLISEEFEEARDSAADEIAPSQMQETIQNFSFEASAPAAESVSASAASQTAPTAPLMAQAVEADEALLDLGDIEPPSATAEADDFILDFQDEAPPPLQPQPAETVAPPTDKPGAQTLDEFTEEMAEAAPQVEEFARLQGETQEQRAEFATAEEFAPVEDGAPEVFEAESALYETEELPETAAATEQPPAEASASQTTSTAVDQQEQHMAGSPAPSMPSQITLEHLSPEVIDAIARRAVEQLSEKVIQEIAWEVVPQLAELIIKQRLEEERK